MPDKDAERMKASSFGVPLVIWVHSFCRSTLATMLALQNCYPGRVQVVVCGDERSNLRTAAGFLESEFDRSRFTELRPSEQRAIEILDSSRDAIHMVCAYHGDPFFERLLRYAVQQRLTYFIAAEAPQNMEQTWFRRLLKMVYIPTILRHNVREYVANSRFMLCYSGDAFDRLRLVGWTKSKVECFGYYPPPIQRALSPRHEDVTFRKTGDGEISFLLTGTHDFYKSPVTLVEASSILVSEGFRGRFHCVIVGEGRQSRMMKDRVAAERLPIVFPGFVSLEELTKLYGQADVFVATGISEPWGIRVNDALNMGCPAIVSGGMGAISLIQETKAGWTYEAGSAADLAKRMRNLIEAPESIEAARAKLKGYSSISPEAKARELVTILRRRFATTS